MGGGKYRALPYYGGKRGNGKAEWIAGLLPWDKVSCYVEPFAGMAGVLLARPPVKVEMLNDLNGRVVNWWRAVRDTPDEFGWLVSNTPRSRDEFQWALTAVDDPDLPPLRRALAFHIQICQSINTGDNVHSPRDWRRRFDPFVYKMSDVDAADIYRLADRLRGVQLENTDALNLLERIAGDRAVIYCDPPYHSANTTPYKEGGLDVERMAELLAAQNGAVAISGYGDEWDMLGWERHERRYSRYQINPNGGSEPEPRTEVLWVNEKCRQGAVKRGML